MTMWSDNRNHLLDDVLTSALLALCAQLIGLPPGQFVALVVLTQLSESLQHANLRLDFGRWGERLWVSPRFHRRHHAIGTGHESVDHVHQRVVLGGHNFGVLLPWWDMLFGTADFSPGYRPTGVRDQVEQGRLYGDGWWAQQWLGLQRLRGTTVTVGLPPASEMLSISALSLVSDVKTIRGSYLGSANPRVEIPQFVDFWRVGILPVEKLLTSVSPMAQVNEAMDALQSAQVVRQVIHPN
jgi:hypothetical protein